ncbi:MAG: enoyl-CoA hydratase/isomerase family protein [Bdellovibrionales bacterium]
METLLFEKKESIGDAKVGIVTFHRPQALNALNSQVMKEFLGLLSDLKKDSSLRCVILTGHGEKSFIAGADIKEMSNFGPSEAKAFSQTGHQILKEIEACPFPFIAAVNGFALGGGCEMAMACDFILSSDNASFGLPEVGLGLLPGFGGTQRLSQFVGVARASEMIFTGKKYSALEAQQFGLVNQVVPAAELLSTALKLASDIAKKGPVAVRSVRQLLRTTGHLSLSEGLKMEQESFGNLFKTADQKEGAAAFVEKRAPQFRGE